LCQVGQVTEVPVPSIGRQPRQNVKNCTEFMSQRFTMIPMALRNAMVTFCRSTLGPDLNPDSFGRPLVSRNRGRIFGMGRKSVVESRRKKSERSPGVNASIWVTPRSGWLLVNRPQIPVAIPFGLISPSFFFVW